MLLPTCPLRKNPLSLRRCCCCLPYWLSRLPVEFNASSRAMKALRESGVLTEEELSGARKVLTAAAMTYVAALFLSLMSFLRLLLIVGGRRRND